MQNKPTIKPPIPMILSAYKAASGFHNFPLSTLHFPLSQLYLCRESSTYVARTLQIDYFLCKTNPILKTTKSTQPYSSQRLTKINHPAQLEKTNPKQTQNKPKTNPKQTQSNPISEKPKMNLNSYSTKAYDNKPRLRAPGKQTQNEPKQTQFLLPQTPHPSQLPTAIIKALRRAFFGLAHNPIPLSNTKKPPKTGSHKMSIKRTLQTAGNKIHTPFTLLAQDDMNRDCFAERELEPAYAANRQEVTPLNVRCN